MQHYLAFRQHQCDARSRLGHGTAASTRRSQRREVDMLFQYPQRITKLVELGFALLVCIQSGHLE
jgi:hypothetical protein